jgi:hypothetical protein
MQSFSHVLTLKADNDYKPFQNLFLPVSPIEVALPKISNFVFRNGFYTLTKKVKWPNRHATFTKNTKMQPHSAIKEKKMKCIFSMNRLQLIRIKPQTIVIILAITFSLIFGCSHTEKVRIPPRVELKPYNYIGVVQFSTNAEDNLGPYVTQNFIEQVQSAQPGTLIIELGSEEQVLRTVGRNKLDLEATRLIGQKFHVDAVIAGHLKVSEIMPKISVYSVSEALKASADVEALLSTRLLETGRGATLWTESTSGKTSVANLNLVKDGAVKFGFSDPKEKYGKLVSNLVYTNTTDFRPRYEYRKVKK